MYTVIVADDEEELRKALVRFVDWEKAGFKVIGEAENGAEALELVEKLEPDLLLTDIHMPFISGIELARQVREIRPNMHIAFLSGYDDFSYAVQAIKYNIISYILKPVSSAEMTDELIKIKDKIDERFRLFASPKQKHPELQSFLMSLLLDEFYESQNDKYNKTLEENAIACGILKEPGDYHRFCVMAVKITDENGENLTSVGTVGAVDIILRKYIKHASFYSNGRIVSLLTATQQRFNKYLHVIVEDLIQSVKRIMGLNCLVGLSRTISRLSACHEAYGEAVNTISYSGGNEGIHHFITDVERAETFDQEKVQAAVLNIESLIRGGSKEELSKWFSELLNDLKTSHISSGTMGFLMIQLVSAVFRIVYAVSGGETVHELQRCSPLEEKIRFDNSDEAWQQYLKFFMSAKDIVAKQKRKSSEIICDNAIEIIESRYGEPDISLVSISEEISVSPNYLSALIKKSTGSTFIDLLTKKRTEAAAELLCCTSIKIREVAEKCGYNDQHYFSYCFKKCFGVSPNAYRRQFENE